MAVEIGTAGNLALDGSIPLIKRHALQNGVLTIVSNCEPEGRIAGVKKKARRVLRSRRELTLSTIALLTTPRIGGSDDACQYEMKSTKLDSLETSQFRITKLQPSSFAACIRPEASGCCSALRDSRTMLFAPFSIIQVVMARPMPPRPPTTR